MNEILFREINNWAGQNYYLDRFMIFSSDWLGYFLILLLITPLLLTFFIRNNLISSWARFVLLKWTYYKEMVVVALMSALVSRFVFAAAIRLFYYHPRPFLVLHNFNLLIARDMESSFPSGHASFYFALATGVYLYNKKAGLIYLVLASLMGFARVFVGVHWPLDILAGAVLGILTAVLTKKIYVDYLKEKLFKFKVL